MAPFPVRAQTGTIREPANALPMTAPTVPLPTTPDHRLARIEAARRAVMNDEPLTAPAMEPWIERSWRRCLASGQRPEQRVGFDVVSSHGVAAHPGVQPQSD
jgi:hypothetical protein